MGLVTRGCKIVQKIESRAQYSTKISVLRVSLILVEYISIQKGNFVKFPLICEIRQYSPFRPQLLEIKGSFGVLEHACLCWLPVCITFPIIVGKTSSGRGLTSCGSTCVDVSLKICQTI